jgi:hypothetical protein
MKIIASIALAVTLTHSAASAQEANPVIKSSSHLRGKSPSATTRNLELRPGEICYTRLEFGVDDPYYPYVQEIDCSPDLLSQCAPYDPSTCYSGVDETNVGYQAALLCHTFAVWPTNETNKCEWAYTCC